MKKFMVTVLIFCAIIFSANVSEGMMRIADVGAEKLVSQIQSEISAKGYPVRITEIWRNPEMDILKDRLYGWRCKYGLKNSAKPDGDITFWTDEQGYVQALRIHYDKSNPTTESSLYIMDKILVYVMTNDDISKFKFYRKQDGHSEGFYVNPRNNKHYCMYIYPRIRTDGSNIIDWGTIIVANSSVNESLSISKEMFLNEMENNGSWGYDSSEKSLTGEIINGK